MERIKKGLSMILLLSLLATTTPNTWANAADSAENAEVSKTDLITVDGKLSEAEWTDRNDLSTILIGDTQEINASFGAAWDNENLYIGVDVASATAEKTDFSDDSITCYLSPYNYRGSPYSSDDFQLQIFNQGTCVIPGAQGMGKNDSLNLSEISVEYAQQADGYTMEIAIPWTVMGTMPHEGSAEMGFDIMAFSSGESCVMQWAGGRWNDTTNNGTLTFTCDGTETVSTLAPLEATFAAGNPLYFSYTNVYVGDSIEIFAADDGTYSDVLYQQEMTSAQALPIGETAVPAQLDEGDYAAAVMRDGSPAATASFSISSVNLSMDKHTYVIGQDTSITISYNNTTSDTDWIGIYQEDTIPSENDTSILWGYAPTTSTSKTICFDNPFTSLGVGSYKAVLLEDGGYNVLASDSFTVAEKEGAAPSLSLRSDDYPMGEESITVYYQNAKTSTDWVGLYAADQTPGNDSPSIDWHHVGSNLSAGRISLASSGLSAGSYKMVLLYQDGYSIMDTVPFTISEVPLSPPAAVNYVRSSDFAGCAEGTVTITEPSNTYGISSYVLYWGDENGALTDYNKIAVLGEGATTYSMVDNTFIPEEATCLLAYSSSGSSYSDEAASFPIPEAWRVDRSGMTASFEVISDTHVNTYGDSNVYNARFSAALADIAATAPDSSAVFTNGDNVDIGSQAYYDAYLAILNKHRDNLPDIYSVIGNHEYFSSGSNVHYDTEMTCAEKAQLYLNNLGAPGIYYDKYIEGIHFIVLGSEEALVADTSSDGYISDDAHISPEQFSWLEGKLAETADTDVPIFVFLHQPMADTVSGTIGGKDGQGWNGLSEDQEATLRGILSDYPQVIMFNGHTHWVMEASHEMYDGEGSEPTIFNTAGIGMLWNDAPVETNVEGSQGCYVETYPDKVLMRGRDFTTGKWIPSASFLVDMTEKYDALTPVLTPGTVSRGSSSTAAASFTSDTAGQYYYAMVEKGAPAPAMDTAQAGTLCGTSKQTIALSSLSSSAKDLYVLVKSDAGRVSSLLKMDIPAYSAPVPDGSSGSTSEKPAAAPAVESSTDGSTTTAAKTVTGTSQSDGTLTARVDDKTAAALVEAAAAAEKAGKQAVVQIKLDGDSSSKAAEVTIPRHSFHSLAEDTSAKLVVDSAIGTLSFDASAVKAMNASVSGDISIRMARTDVSRLSAQEKAQVGSRPVYDFTVTSGNGSISGFGDGKAHISLPYTPAPGEHPSAIVVYYLDEDGQTETIQGSYHAATGTVEFTTAHFSRYAVGYNEVSFLDVDPAAWYHSAVTFIAARGITTGTGEDAFSPDVTLTRAQFLVMLMRAYHISPDAAPRDNFADAGSEYYTNYLSAAKHLGITAGVGNNLFAPDSQITRQEMFTLLYRGLNVLGELPEEDGRKALDDFDDAAAIADYAHSAVDTLVKAGVVSGSDGRLDPTGTSTRSQMAQVLYHLLCA